MDLKTYYQQTVTSELAKELKIVNLLAIPKLSKIVINVGVGEALTNKKALDIVAGHLTLIRSKAVNY